jgi:hypothetical protein
MEADRAFHMAYREAYPSQDNHPSLEQVLQPLELMPQGRVVQELVAFLAFLGRGYLQTFYLAFELVRSFGLAQREDVLFKKGIKMKS